MPGESRPPFRPGDDPRRVPLSPNPGGRPRKTDEMRKAEEMARGLSPEAIQHAADIMRSAPKEADRLKAVEIILDRALGKPTQAITAEVEHMGTVDGDAALREFDQRVARFLAALRGPAPLDAVVVEQPALPPKDPDASR